jgi:hypothetical protein
MSGRKDGNRRCDGLTRRDFVRIGGLTAFGLGASALTQFSANTATAAPEHSGTAQLPGTAKRAVLIWLDGGPSHLETFDLKPKAPAEVRGPFEPISTQIAGTQICELMPRTAQLMDRVALIRSLTSPLGEHNFGAHYVQTGYKPTPVVEYPSVGSVFAHFKGSSHVLPGHVAVPQFRVGGGKFSGHGFLPESARPFSVGGDPSKPDFKVRDLDFYPGLDETRIDRRQQYLAALDRFRKGVESKREAQTESGFEQAFRLISSTAAREAFDLSKETSATRNRYGRKSVGQSCLLARRLLERDVPFVTVSNPGWDTHNNAYTRLKEGYTGARVPVGLIPSLDMAFAGLIEDLEQRDMLQTTLIVVMGEFGRTPKLNTDGGRDHWPRVFSVAMAGGGVAGGHVIGSSDPVGEGPKDRPVTPADLAATMYTLLGVDPALLMHTSDGRPIRASRDGQVIQEVLA